MSTTFSTLACPIFCVGHIENDLGDAGIQTHPDGCFGDSEIFCEACSNKVGKSMSKKGSRTALYEIFSPPRLSLLADKFNVLLPKDGAAFDLELGWNVFVKRDRALFWKRLEEDDPYLCVLGPECKPFSQIMESNWSRMSTELAEHIKQEGLEMLSFSAEVALHRIRRGRKFVLEQPAFASSWATHAIRYI